MKSIKLIKPYFFEKRLLIFFGLACLIVVDFLQLFIPRIIKWAVDDITAFRVDAIRLSYYALYIVGIAVLIALFRYGWRRCLIGTSRRLEEGLRNRLFAHIQTLSPSFFDKTKTGDIMAHATNDIQHIRMATGMGMVALTDSIVLGSAAIGFMAYINVKLTLFVLIPMPMIIFGTRFFSKKMHRLYQEVQGTFSDLTEVTRERFAGIRIIKAYNREKDERIRLENISKNYINSNLRLARITGSFFPMMLLFSNISFAIVLYLGGRQTIGLTITPGDFVAFISYLGLLTWPMMAMGWVINLLQRGRASLDRIDKILQNRPEIADFSGAEHLELIQGSIGFENVTFSYGHDKKPVLAGINIKLDKGKVLGIVGAPGSGKTTFANLIPRLFDVTGGRITLDKKDIRNILLKDLRAQISFMPQEPFLFAGTIRENILLGNKEANEKELVKAVKQASLYSTIKSFSDGFETITGEKGVILSGGQKQRIALARALLRDSPILILDDPVSQVDMETGSAIINTIKSLAGIKTVIIISHRLSAVQFADQIIVLDSGRIIESGTHEEVMENDRYYAKTFRLQEIEEELNAY
ncbi:MAG: ABC transporter ATP-binding protein/permease [Deltaproteobacteria bacterium]|nr:ABC transporter ATP-binding protein/permease [Deltaproteobacteria bacterium]